ncbi:cytochrome P450 [Vararia minispora EC-137]|uniref:Cytochrome P450 n=1 Tax=Vararia minispora EC-137 TaxID=1314806 RepID=A0ACB8Q5R7_9AGAM|nr:cytochrome P450 [Vararia minispora EC-137]
MLYETLWTAVFVVSLILARDIAKLLRDVIRPYFSPLRTVPGPRPTSWLRGNLREIIKADPSEMHDEWEQEYGPVLKYKVMMGQDRLSITDVRALGHILAHSMDYEKPRTVRQSLTDILGAGLLVVEGEVHKQQRRVMSPAFGTPQIRALMETFFDKSIQMKDIWLRKLRSGEFEMKSGAAQTGKIEVAIWLSRVTIDIIGLAGFGYDFEALDEQNKSGGELNHTFRVLLQTLRPGFVDTIQGFLPITRIFPSARLREVRAARKTLDRVGKRLLEERKAAIRASTAVGSDGKIDRKLFQDKDILTLLVRANMASDLPENARMTDDEVLAQIPTFLLAGHETTSTAVTWILYALSLNPSVQDKLRAELLACSEGDRPSMETLNGLPYLDAVVRETMRLYSPVSNAIRVATKADVIPTEQEWVDVHGVRRSGIPHVSQPMRHPHVLTCLLLSISKGDSIFIPILTINRSKTIWGEDAREYRPERWLSDLSPAFTTVPGVWGNMLSFLGGNRACIGWRFSLFEMKVLVYTLVRAFRFELAVKAEDIQMRQSVVTRPHLRDKIEAGPQLPVWVTALVDEAS